jgi:predicted NBD/HSP70 family sugar kinase
MTQALTGKPQLSRQVNRTLILDRIRRMGKISRADLARVTEIRPPTVSAVISELIDERLVEEIGTGATNGGRAPVMVALRRREPRAIGFEITETAIRAGVADLAGELCRTEQVPWAPHGVDETLERINQLGTELLSGLGLGWDNMDGIGVAVQGHLDAGRGIIRWSSPFGWRDVPLRELCEKRWNRTTDVVNDSVAGSMAAQFLATGSQVSNLVFLTVRFSDASHGVLGLGSGVIINGEPFHGEFGAAGEITTPVVHPLATARDDGRPYRDISEFTQALSACRPAAVEAMDRVARDIAVLVEHAMNFLEPGMLVIGTDIAALQDELLVRVRRIVDAHQLAHEAGKTSIVGSMLGEYGVVRGAIVPTLQRVFCMPRWT